MGTTCKSEGGSRTSSPRQCFSPSRRFSGDCDSEHEVAYPLSLDVCGSIKDVASPIHPLTQKRRLVPYYGVHRDKESLLEEVLALLNAFQDQNFHFLNHKTHHNAVLAINRKLESQCEFLETSGLEATRTGTLTKLKSKLKGCKARILDLELVCATNAAELRRLQMDFQVLQTQEVTVQREQFANEVRRLQNCTRHLRNLYTKVLDDNKEVACVKKEIPTITAKNNELETSVTGKSKSIKEMTAEMAEWKAKAVVAQRARSTDASRFLSLQDDAKSLEDLLFAEKLAKENFTTMVNTLAHQVRIVERETREKEKVDVEAASAPISA